MTETQFYFWALVPILAFGIILVKIADWQEKNAEKHSKAPSMA